MKKIKWYKECDSIPSDATFLRERKTIKENIRDIDCDCHSLMPCSCVEYDLVEYFLYEVEEE